MDEPYELLPEDAEYLDAHHSGEWSKVAEGVGKFGLIVQHFRIPDGYVKREATLMLLVPSGYPGVPIDMFYFHPPIQRRNGGTIPRLENEAHFGITWQRWSRHYQWQPGQDNIVTHIEYVRNELRAQAER